jgi:hypothetical protein
MLGRGQAAVLKSPYHLHTFSILPAHVRVALHERNEGPADGARLLLCRPVTVGGVLRLAELGDGWQR